MTTEADMLAMARHLSERYGTPPPSAGIPEPGAHSAPEGLPPSLMPGGSSQPPTVVGDAHGMGAMHSLPSPVRRGVTEPGFMLDDNGQQVPLPPIPSRPPALHRQPAGRRPPALPGQFHGGQYYPPGNEIELSRLRGEITDRQASEAEAARERYQHSVPGLDARMHRQRNADDADNLDTMAPALEARGHFYQEQANVEERRADFLRSEQLAQKARSQEYQREYDVQLGKYNLALQDIEKSKIDPTRLSRTTGQKIERGIRGFLGALGASLLGRPNEVAQQMAQEIDRDIAAQAKNLEGKRQSADAKRSILGIMRERYGDAEQAAAATRRYMFGELDAQLGRAAAQTEGAEHQARIAQLRNGVGQRARMTELALEQQAQARADEAARQRALMLLRGQRARGGASGKDLDARYVRGHGIAPTSNAASAMREAMADTRNGVETVNKLLGLADKSGKSLLPGDRAAATLLAAQLKMQLNKGAGLGALDAGSLELLDAIVANPAETFTLDSTNKRKLSTAKAQLQAQLRSRAQATGFIPARQEVTPKGVQYHYGESPGTAPGAVDFRPTKPR